MKHIIYILLFLNSFNAVAQKYADKEYYLVDSLVLEELTEGDRELIDNSLKKYHSAEEDSSQINALNDICENVMHDDWSKFQFYQYELIKKLIKNNGAKGLKKSLANALNNIGFLYNYQGDIPRALAYFHESLKIQEEIGDKKGIAHSFNNIGVIYDDQGDITKALEYYHKSLKIQEEIGEKKGITNELNNIGYVYNEQGDIAKALEYYHKSLKIQEEIGYKKGIANSLNNIGVIYSNQEDLPKALSYYRKSLKIQQEIGDKKGIALSFNNIGVIYVDQGDIAKALEYYHKSLKIEEEIGYKKGIASSLNNIGVIYKTQGDIPQALSYCHKGLKIYEEIGDKRGIANSLNNIGNIELKKESASGIAVAKQHFLKALEIAQEIGYPDVISDASSNLSKVYEKQGKGMKALAMHKLHIQMRDSINNETTQKASIQQGAKYAFEKVQAVKDAEHEKQLAIEKEAKAKQQVITDATFAGLGLAAIFLLFVLNRLKVTRKQKVVIEIQNIELAKKNTEKEYMMKEIHHRVKNNLQVVISLLKFQSIEIDDPKIVSMFEDCQNRILSMASVHEQMYKSENLMEIRVDKHLLSLVTDLIKDYNIDTEIEPVINVESIDMGIKTLIPLGLITNEIVSNSIKHAFINRKRGVLTISLMRIDEIRFELTIRDDGVGYQDSNGQGLGLELIEIFSQQLDASIEKRIKNGTFYKIIFKDQDK
jgi:two-component sensor histidine kinase/Tfp pilus assembly protein PilF